jgi:type II secretory pathway component PulK
MSGATRRRHEAGYALLAVLWMTVGIAGLAFLIAENARDAIATSRNRIALTEAAWNASACGAHLRAVLAEAQVASGFRRDVRSLLQPSQETRDLGCDITFQAVGSRLDVNAADSATLARLFRYAGMAAGQAETTAAALVLHKPYADSRAFRLVPGLQGTATLESLLDVEPGPIALNYAPGPVLALLPGFTDRTVREVLDARARDQPVSTFHDLSRLLSADAPGAAARLPAVSVFQPLGWVLTVHAHAGAPSVTSVLELRLAQDGRVTRWRSWIE